MRVLRWVVGAAASIIIVVFGGWLASEVVSHGKTLSAQGAALSYQKEQLADLRKDLANLAASQKQIAALLKFPRNQVAFAGFPIIEVKPGVLVVDNLTGKMETWKVPLGSRITLDGKESTLKAIGPGMRVFMNRDPKTGAVAFDVHTVGQLDDHPKKY